jgi:tetratricopeptide (TPR) repeat protein
MKMKINLRIGAALLLALIFSISAHAQQTPINQFELASDVRAKARTLSDRGNYEAALAVIDSLEAGKYDLGDAATQAAAAKITTVQTDKGRILIKLGRYDDADASFYRAFDTNIANAEKSLEVLRGNWTGGEISKTKSSSAEDSLSLFRGGVSLADGVVGLRDASYMLAGASNSAKPFDAARLAKLDSLRKALARFLR